MTTRDFLFELGTEELPPKALRDLESALRDHVVSSLAAAGLAHGSVESFAAPRRLALLVRSLANEQPRQQIRRRGPPVNAAFDASGAPTRAATAFADSCGVPVSALERVREGKGEFLYFSGEKPGASTASLLPGFIAAALDALPIPKRMRWGSGSAEFVRPVHWVVMLFGDEVVDATLLDVRSGRSTRGHRFMAPAAIELGAPSEYAEALRSRGKVIADFAARREHIRSEVERRAAALGARAILSDALLDEVTALVEWPVAIEGSFEARFLELPREVLISTLQDHQRYFPLESPAGRLLPTFITLSNLESRDPAQVRAGNERVVRPRLSDAEFFFRQDRKASLASRAAALDSVTFQAKLGSIGDKSRRIEALSASIASSIGADVSMTKQCAALAKCDLVTHMVGEFPELQGVMGSYYAAADGLPAEVAQGIREHYLPRGAGDALPATRVGLAVALADRLDTLAGIFAIGQKPTGARDPFGLRRAAIGVLRLLIELRVDLDLRDCIDQAVAAQPVRSAAAAEEVHQYVLERLRAYYLEGRTGEGGPAGIATTGEQLDAVLATAPRSPLDLDARLRALAGFLAQPAAAALTAANKRIANILRKSDAGGTASVDAALLREPAEQALAAALKRCRDPVERALDRRDYAAALAELATLRGDVDTFFDAVMVNDPDPALRANRLALLGDLAGLFGRIADLSRLPG
jgi:glycyl-tRNA synthetase beta chain